MVVDLVSPGEELVNATFVSPCVPASIVRQTDRQSAVRTQLSCVWETPRSGASFEKKGGAWRAVCAEGNSRAEGRPAAPAAHPSLVEMLSASILYLYGSP